jgi:signal transduction histidine kinase
MERAVTIRSILLNILLPGAGLSLGVAWATGNWNYSSLVTGYAGAAGMMIFRYLDQLMVQHLLKKMTKDWLRFGLENIFSLLGHLIGVFIPLLICSNIFGFTIHAITAWMVFGGLLIGFPIIHGTGNAVRFYRQLKEKERIQEHLRTLAAQAELKALQAQINPHFLFNTLNTIAQLIHSDVEKAEATVERLAEIFRYTLSASKKEQVLLNEELKFIDEYLDIERIRFGDRLQVEHRIAQKALNVPMPSLILQPVVENVIKHGQGLDGRIQLTIQASLDSNHLILTITDQGPGFPADYRLGAGMRTGLTNVDERLKKTYGPIYGLRFKPNKPLGTVVLMRIPFGEDE